MFTLSPSNATLVRQVLRGRRERFDVLVRRHLNAVYAVTYAVTTNHADAEDVAQDAFLKAYISLDTLREPGKFEGWLITIARNCALRAMKKRGREKRLEKEAPAPAGDAAVDLARDELYRLLGEKMQALDTAHREVLMLHYYAGMRSREIARALGLTQAAVLKRLQRARAALGGKLIEEIFESRRGGDWVDARAEQIGKLVLAASIGWTATGTGGGLAFGTAFLSGRLLAAAVAGLASVAAVAAAVYFRAPESGEPGPVVVANDDTDAATEDSGVAPEPAAIEPEPDTTAGDIQAEVREEESTPKVPVPVNATIAEALLNPASIAFEDIHLCAIADFVTNKYELPILLDSGAVYAPDALQAAKDPRRLHANEPIDTQHEYLTDGMIETMDMRDFTLLEMLDEICSALGLAYVSEPGFVWISTAESIAREVEPEPESRFAVYENEARMQKRGSLAFNGIHVSEVLDFVAVTYDVNLVMDSRAVRPPAGNSTPIPQGYVTDGHVPVFIVRDIELRDTLKALLRPLGLTYQVRGNAVVISSAERLAQQDGLEPDLLSPEAMCEKRKAYRAALALNDSN